MHARGRRADLDQKAKAREERLRKAGASTAQQAQHALPHQLQPAGSSQPMLPPSQQRAQAQQQQQQQQSDITAVKEKTRLQAAPLKGWRNSLSLCAVYRHHSFSHVAQVARGQIASVLGADLSYVSYTSILLGQMPWKRAWLSWRKSNDKRAAQAMGLHIEGEDDRNWFLELWGSFLQTGYNEEDWWGSGGSLAAPGCR
eukprot:1144461-Pelagomonas_calceolata.AAC.1